MVTRLNIFYGLAISLIVLSCNKENSDYSSDDDLMGQWLLFKRFDGDDIDPVDYGKILTFTKDSIFKDSWVPDCDGIFSLDRDTITILRPCHDRPIRYLFKCDQRTLILTSVPSSCDEGCYDIFKRL